LARTKNISAIGSSAELETPTRTFCLPSPNFYRRGKKCKIWPRFSTLVAFDALSFRSYVLCADKNMHWKCRWLSYVCNLHIWCSLVHPALRTRHWNIWKFNPLKCLARAMTKLCYTSGNTWPVHVTWHMKGQRSNYSVP